MKRILAIPFITLAMFLVSLAILISSIVTGIRDVTWWVMTYERNRNQ